MAMDFWRCYECSDGLHERCIGVPCQCECPPTTAERIAAELEQAESVVERLKSALALAHGEEIPT